MTSPLRERRLLCSPTVHLHTLLLSQWPTGFPISIPAAALIFPSPAHSCAGPFVSLTPISLFPSPCLPVIVSGISPLPALFPTLIAKVLRCKPSEACPLPSSAVASISFLAMGSHLLCCAGILCPLPLPPGCSGLLPAERAVETALPADPTLPFRQCPLQGVLLGSLYRKTAAASTSDCRAPHFSLALSVVVSVATLRCDSYLLWNILCVRRGSLAEDHCSLSANIFGIVL